ncbi:hypothetical protein E2C01_007095 [Portunus trituberculatus]|uniref:Uncharacterized protein n=1 Tax=Portunus trituberculatus TaxID=210409 RepID=A0A5B7CY12_PORTR|nr:hypothetical protein [Portunus trituberculatus]
MHGHTCILIAFTKYSQWLLTPSHNPPPEWAPHSTRTTFTLLAPSAPDEQRNRLVGHHTTRELSHGMPGHIHFTSNSSIIPVHSLSSYHNLPATPVLSDSKLGPDTAPLSPL